MTIILMGYSSEASFFICFQLTRSGESTVKIKYHLIPVIYKMQFVKHFDEQNWGVPDEFPESSVYTKQAYDPNIWYWFSAFC